MIIDFSTTILALAIAATQGSSTGASRPGATVDTAVIYLVRHGEVAPDGTPDPPLSEAGRRRAASLPLELKDARLTGVLSTNLKRTRETAGPIAAATGHAPAFYGPRDLGRIADSLKNTAGRTLIVGHSNTTPELVRLLGGDPGTPIGEGEFDRLYVITIPPGGPVATALRRYRPAGS